MSKKKINIALILALLVVWGGVAFKFFKNYFLAPAARQEFLQQPANVSALVAQRDTFVLKPLERDPFGHAEIRAVATGKERQKTNRFIPKKTPGNSIMHNWPDIKYHGYFKSSKKEETAMININGRLYKMHKGETNADIMVKKIYKDSVALLFNGKQRIFAKM
jgi:hypothetical protein